MDDQRKILKNIPFLKDLLVWGFTTICFFVEWKSPIYFPMISISALGQIYILEQGIYRARERKWNSRQRHENPNWKWNEEDKTSSHFHPHKILQLRKQERKKKTSVSLGLGRPKDQKSLEPLLPPSERCFIRPFLKAYCYTTVILLADL